MARVGLSGPSSDALPELAGWKGRGKNLNQRVTNQVAVPRLESFRHEDARPCGFSREVSLRSKKAVQEEAHS